MTPMTAPSRRRVFYGVLDMGLGHATRSLPLLREFVLRGWDLHVGSSGRALALLQSELPGVPTVTFPGYGIRYSKRGVSLPALLLQAPRLLAGVRGEHRIVGDCLREHPADLVVSDHCFGCHADGVPSYMITHQLRFIAPALLRPIEGLGVLFNRGFEKHFTGLIVPDQADPDARGGRLSGRLSRSDGTRTPVRYAGPLADLPAPEPVETSPEVDVLVIVSGPEPQRSALEGIVRAQIGRLAGRRVVVLGRPESAEVERPEPGLEIHHHAGRALVASLMARAQVVVTRSGYSTLMELAEHGGRALLIPTPGQTEQEYLARRLEGRGWAAARRQKRLDLAEGVAAAAALEGIPAMGGTRATVDRLFEEVFERGGT